ncbi:pseudaminic acid cytidylyltransferase [Halomonas sp. EF61]|uniref:pseudaminic acid cytidylyltransferase n=1 Tax=Halomonas sp. EF61 TaxID=2950869 RepID=UPI0032DF8049
MAQNIAVIPARGGSKRIPRKNIKNFLGTPMIGYSINLALSSGIFDRVIVSTDDEEISKIAIELGAEVPFVRDAKLADDLTPTLPVIRNTIQVLGVETTRENLVCCIYPCAPFVTIKDLIVAKKLVQDYGEGFCYPVVEYAHPVQRAMKMNSEGLMSFFTPENELKRTQDFELSYHDAGQFYWGSTESWSVRTSLHSNSVGLPIPNWRVVDIDTPDDWVRAEKLYRTLFNSG